MAGVHSMFIEINFDLSPKKKNKYPLFISVDFTHFSSLHEGLFHTLPENKMGLFLYRLHKSDERKENSPEHLDKG